MIKLIALLKIAFGECKRPNKSLCHSKTSYEIISTGFFFVADLKGDEKEEPVKIVGDKDNYQLRVQNKNKKDVCLIKTDNCLFEDDHKKCDCILFNEDKFFMVEISESGQRNRKRGDAIKQLEDTIQILNENSIDLSALDAKAIVCFKGGKTKPLQTSFNTKRAAFRTKYNVSLEEGNFISF